MIATGPFTLAYALDWLLGDPAWLPHPVRWMGWMIGKGEWFLRLVARTRSVELVAGFVLTVFVVAIFAVGSWWFLSWLERIPLLALVATVYLGASTLATRSLLDESRAVNQFLRIGDLTSARVQVARIVGRDTHDLDEAGVARATIETLAESASDGIVAPMFYLAIGGVPAALAYKAINTLDSMIGHRGERYEYFGKFAARLDDVANFLPSRLTALLIVVAAWTIRFDWANSWRMLWRDGAKHKSPNAGRPEAAMAGALGVRLGGTNFYDGEGHHGQHLGDAQQSLDSQALSNALRLTRYVSLVMFVLCWTTLLLSTFHRLR
jgi:adenosylcobinamide-phosphate synthase